MKKSDIKAVLDELGGAMKHFFEMGQKIRLDGIGIFKVGFSSIGVIKLEDCGAANITTRRVLFQPETTRVVVGQEKKSNGSVKQKYVNAITLLKDVVFEETHDNAMNAEPEDEDEAGSSTSSGTGTEGGNSGSQQGNNSQQGGSSTGSDTAQGFALTISTSGSGSSTVTLNGSAVNSGASLNEDDEVEISITPAEGQVPTATINGSEIELTESEGVYSGSFAMPGQASSLVINTGGSSGGNGGADLDKD